MTLDRDPPSDFTIARGIEDRGLIEQLLNYLAGLDSQRIELSRTDLQESLDRAVSKQDAECLFTGLVLCGVAEQASAGTTFSEYTFSIDTDSAEFVLRDQLVARSALNGLPAAVNPYDEGTVELAATFPPDFGQLEGVSVVTISEELRQLLFDADESVRIANPYFNPDQTVIGDIAALAARDVETRILTRETRKGTSGLAKTLNRIHEAIPDDRRGMFHVRDLYERDRETGQQAFATHAKIAIADEELCYIGSANLTRTSLSSNFELGVILRDELAVDAARIFDHVFGYARDVDLPI